MEHSIIMGYKCKKISNYSFFNLFYDLRIWANYTGVDSLIQLDEGGYTKFLRKNLNTIVFLFGGLAEICYLSVFGKDRLNGLMHYFTSKMINKYTFLKENKYNIPMFIRMRSYKHLGLIDSNIDYLMPGTKDPMKFIDIQS